MSSPAVRPHSSLLKQQRLPAWQPILTPPHVSACFLLTCAIFVPLGVVILQANDDVVTVEIPYNQIRACTNNNNDALYNYTVGNSTTSMGCLVSVDFDIPALMTPPIYIYYRLSNFYQNHRRYSGSRLDPQLAGDAASSISDADPVATVGDINGLTGTEFVLDGVNRSYSQFVYSPAGLIAWSMFNDSFTLWKYLSNNPNTNTPKELICNGSDFSRYTNLPLGNSNHSCSKQGIAWTSDVSDKFKVPSVGSGVWAAPWSGWGMTPLASNSPYYTNGWYAGEAGHVVPATTDEDLMVWMRTASLPDFKKLYRIINVALPPGTYRMDIVELFDVSSFAGTKAFTITTLSWLGSKNPFLAMVYLVVGGLSFVAALAFALIHNVFGDRTQRAIDELNHDTN